MIRLSSLLLVVTSLYFRNVGAGENCDVIRTGSVGEIKSPNHPFDYFPNLKCHYSITTEPGTIIRLTFQAFETQRDGWGKDIVEIYDGDNVNATMVGSFSGTSLPPEVRSSQNTLFLLFKTDVNSQYSGFFANYSTIIVTAPPVQNVSVTTVSSSSALVRWKGLGAPFSVDSYTVNVTHLARRHSIPPGCPALPPLHSAVTVTVNGSTTETVISLPTDLQFQVFVTSLTAGGIRGLASDIVTGYTLPSASEAVGDLNVELIDAGETVRFTWKSPCNPGGPLSHFLVVLEVDDNDSFTENFILNRTAAEPLKEMYSNSIAISELTAESAYNVTVIPVGHTGLYGANQTTSFQVPARLPTPLQNVVATAVSSSSVRVEWAAPPENPTTITHYTVRVTPITRPRAFVPPLQTSVVKVSGSTLQTEVTNLMSDTLYQATVTAATAAGEGPLSVPSLAQLPSEYEVPTQPQNVSATALSTSAVRVEWDPPAQSHGKVTFYIVTLEPLNSTSLVPPINKTVVTVTGTTFKAEIDRLLAGTEYQVVVSAATSFGQGPPSTPSLVLTPPEDEGKILLALEILRSSYIKSRDLLCSVEPRSKEKEYQHLCRPTGEN